MPAARGLHELLEVSVGGDVEVDQQDQRSRAAARRRRLVAIITPREVNAVEGAEVDHRPVRDAVAHGGEEALDVALARLARTGATIVSERWYGIDDAAARAHWLNSSEKWRTLSFSQKTSPR